MTCHLVKLVILTLTLQKAPERAYTGLGGVSMRGFTNREKELLRQAQEPRTSWTTPDEAGPLVERGLFRIEWRHAGFLGHIHLTELGELARRMVLAGLVAFLAGWLCGCSGDAFTELGRGTCPDTVRECEPIPTGATPDAAQSSETLEGDASAPESGKPAAVDADAAGTLDAPVGTCPASFVACVCAADAWCCQQWAESCESLGYAIGCGMCS